MRVQKPTFENKPHGKYHCWGFLGFLQSLPTIHSSHWSWQTGSLEQIQWFEAIFRIFAHAIEVEGQSMLNFEAAT